MNKIPLSLIVVFLFFSCSQSREKSQQVEIAQDTTLVVGSAKTYIPQLPDELNEISGMLVWRNLYWGFNDSGGDPVLYGFDDEGNIKMEVELVNADNHDWESIAQDDDYIYVGDFGNNFGSREDLCIYKINKKEISDEVSQKIEAEKINIRYASQNSFVYSVNSTPFDCEAMTEFNGKLLLFSKNWRDNTTELYQLSTDPGSYTLVAVDTLVVNLLVTGADISPDKTKLALIGYLDYQTYLWLFTNFSNNFFNSSEALQIHLQNIDGAQTEGIYFLNNDSLLISCEQTSGYDQQVFLFDLNSLKDGTHQGQ